VTHVREGAALAPTVGATRFPARASWTRVRVEFGRYELAFAGLIGIALAARVVELTAKPFHHDESEHAWFAWLFVSGRGYHYDPVFHGPVQFYVMSLLYLLIGAGDLAARLAPALVGTVLVGLPYLLRRQIGSVAALAAGVLFCISPSYLYFSRFVREDIYAACVTLALIVAIFRFLARPRPWHPSLILGLLAICFAVKETAYITVAVFGSFFAVALLWQARQAESVRRAALAITARSVGRDAWIWGAATFVTVYTLLFTTFLTNPHGLQDGLIESIRYWLSQQPVNRGGQPPFYYLVVLPAYEWPVLLLAAVGVVGVVRRATLLGLFLVWDFVVSLAVYSAAGERMPWLILHPLLPLVLLAGVGMQALWTNRRRLPARVGLALAAAGAAWSIWTAGALSYGHPADPREMLVFTQTSVDVPRVRDRIFGLDRYLVSHRSRHLRLEVDGWSGSGWPWGWYLRELPVAYPDMSETGFRPTGDALIVTDVDRPHLLPFLRGYRGRRFHLRVWWVVDYGGGSLREWARWFVHRRQWGPLGSTDQWLYVRKGFSPSPGR
jgi:uncharacterized protein (TIGR03663 family)